MLHEIMGIERALPWLIGALAAGYLIGSVPVGVIVARFFDLGDLRKIGSGSTGATNVLRTGNKKAAALTLFLDALKGAIPVLIFLNWGDLAGQIAGLGAVIGHCFPIWLKFRGGKGVATFIGVIFAIYWPVGLMICANWSMAARLTKISSVGGLAIAVAAPIWLAVFNRWEAVLVTILLGLIIWIRHHENIRRLIAGTEPKIGARK